MINPWKSLTFENFSKWEFTQQSLNKHSPVDRCKKVHHCTINNSGGFLILKFLMARGRGAAGAGVGSPSALSNSYRHVFAIRH